MSIKDFLEIFPIYLNPPDIFESLVMQNAIFSTVPELGVLLSLYGHPADGDGEDECKVYEDDMYNETTVSYPVDKYKPPIFKLTIRTPTYAVSTNEYIYRKKILMSGKFEGIRIPKIKFPDYLAIHDILARKNCLIVKLELK